MDAFLESTQKSLDAIAFAVRAIFAALGVESCAQRMGCDAKTAYAYQVDQVIPTKRLVNLLTFSRETKNPSAIDGARKIVGVFAEAAGCKVVDATLVEHFNKGMDALNNGGRLHEERQEKCPYCKSLLFTERTASGVIIMTCRRCHGAGQLNG